MDDIDSIDDLEDLDGIDDCCDDMGHPPSPRGTRVVRKRMAFGSMRPFHGSRRIIRKKLLDKDSFWETQDLILLGFIKEEPNGITGYDLQKALELPRGTMNRILDRLEKDNYLAIREETAEGRLKKIYTISENGCSRLRELQIKMAQRAEIIDDVAPMEEFGRFRDLGHHDGFSPEGEKRIIKRMMRGAGGPRGHGRTSGPRSPGHQPRRIRRYVYAIPPHALESKENTLDFLKGHRDRMNAHLNRIQHRLNAIDGQRTKLNEVISQIEALSEDSREKIKEILQSMYQKPTSPKKKMKTQPEDKPQEE